MDLSIRSRSVEAIEYKHKKFGQVRSSPINVELHESMAESSSPDARSMAGTPHSCTSNSTSQRSTRRDWEDNDTTWEPELPCTPTKRRRIQTRTCRNKRLAAYDLCNAPKKSKTGQYDARAATPEKISEDITPSTSLMPKISKEVLARICHYNKNMVRKFPKKERTVKDQERRDKNTIACRMSRRLKKLEHLAVEEQYKIFIHEHLEQSKQAMYAAVYLNELLKFGVNVPTHEQNGIVVESIAKKLGLQYLTHIPRTDISTSSGGDALRSFDPERNEEIKDTKGDHLKDDDDQNVQPQKRSFSIAFILGTK